MRIKLKILCRQTKIDKALIFLYLSTKISKINNILFSFAWKMQRYKRTKKVSEGAFGTVYEY